MKSVLREGDRVITNCSSKFFAAGETGVVVVAIDDFVGVCFDGFNIYRHSLEGRCGVGHGRWFRPYSGGIESGNISCLLLVDELGMEDNLPDFNFDPDNYRDLVQKMK